MEVEYDRNLASLVQRPQAARAHVHPAQLAVNFHPRALNVGLELAIGCLFRVAYIVAELRALATHLALSHSQSPLRLYAAGQSYHSAPVRATAG